MKQCVTLLASWVFISIFAASLSSVYAQAIAITFHDLSWAEIQAKATEEGKLIFIDAYAPYCMPCKMMDNAIFNNNLEVALFFNEHFISYKVDMSKDENMIFQEKYEIYELPTLLFLTATGELLKTEVGGMSSQTFLTKGKEVVNSLDQLYTPPLVDNTTSQSTSTPNTNNPILDTNATPITTSNSSQNIGEINNQEIETTTIISDNNPPVSYIPDEQIGLATDDATAISDNPPAATFDTYPSPKRWGQNPTPTPNASNNSPTKKTPPPSTRQNNWENRLERIPKPKPKPKPTPPPVNALPSPPPDDVIIASFQRLELLKKLYQDGNRHAELLHEYAYLAKKHYQPYNTIVNEFLNQQAQQIGLPENRKFVYDFSINLENDAIEYFLNDLQHFKDQYGGKKINEKIKAAVQNSIFIAIKERDYTLFDKAQRVVQQAHLPFSKHFLFEIRALFYQGVDDWVSYSDLVIDYIERNNVTDPLILNDAVWKFYQYIHDKRKLKLALDWIKTSIAIDDECYNNHTHAVLLYKMGRFEEAITACRRVIELAQIRGIDYQESLRLLDRIESAK